MPQYLTHGGGRLRISEIANGRRRIDVEPSDASAFVPIESIETAYPIELIRLILKIKGIAWICDEIARDENPSYVAKYLLNDLFAHFDPSDFNGSRILDFGCGSGASTAILARTFLNSTIVGVELESELLSIARERANFYDFKNVEFRLSPSASDLPPDIETFDYVVMSAVYEHLLPDERKVVLNKLWKCVRRGGALFLDQTPNQLFPIELHTTYLPFINYFPDSLAHWYARKFSKRIDPTDSWTSLLRQGIRGATIGEIMKNIERTNGKPILLKPEKNGAHDLVDLWLKNTNSQRLTRLKSVAKFVLKATNSLTGMCIVPDLVLAIRKEQ
jgi:ubiquinone/menaquinone biosynthesis C-methylase UbiE